MTSDVHQSRRYCSVPELGLTWTKCLRSITGAEQIALSPKDFGQLSRLREEGKDDTENIIRWALANWAAFSREVVKRSSLRSAPLNPHMGFLLAHRRVAILMLDQARQPSLKQWLMSEED